MARVEGVDPKQTSFLMRQVFNKVRKLVGRDLTPQKITARVPRVFWAFNLAELLLGQKAKVSAAPAYDYPAAHGRACRMSVLN